jgi:hypothetical protein
MANESPWPAPHPALQNVHPSQLHEPPGHESGGSKALKSASKWYLAGAHPVAVVAARQFLGDYAPTPAERTDAYWRGRGGHSGFRQDRRPTVHVHVHLNEGEPLPPPPPGGRTGAFHGSASVHRQGS